MQQQLDGASREIEALRPELSRAGLPADEERAKFDVYERKRRDATRLRREFTREVERQEAPDPRRHRATARSSPPDRHRAGDEP